MLLQKKKHILTLLPPSPLKYNTGYKILPNYTRLIDSGEVRKVLNSMLKKFQPCRSIIPIMDSKFEKLELLQKLSNFFVWNKRFFGVEYFFWKSSSFLNNESIIGTINIHLGLHFFWASYWSSLTTFHFIAILEKNPKWINPIT